MNAVVVYDSNETVASVILCTHCKRSFVCETTAYDKIEVEPKYEIIPIQFCAFCGVKFTACIDGSKKKEVRGSWLNARYERDKQSPSRRLWWRVECRTWWPSSDKPDDDWNEFFPSFISSRKDAIALYKEKIADENNIFRNQFRIVRIEEVPGAEEVVIAEVVRSPWIEEVTHEKR